MVHLKGVDPRMIANNLMPYKPVHPGEILKDEIEFRGISQRSLAKQMGVSYSVLNEILNSKRPISTQYALLFEAALGIDAKPLIGMQADYDMQIAMSDKNFKKRLTEIRKMTAML